MDAGWKQGWELELAGEQLVLLPERAVWWTRRRTLLLADTHFGKAAVFRTSGIPVPAGTTGMILTRISRLLQQFQAERLAILGDFVHSPARTERDFAADLIEWRTRHAAIEILLVRGNHDRGQERLWEELRLEVVEEPWFEDPFVLCHLPPGLPTPVGTEDCGEPVTGPSSSAFALAGHLHPCVRLSSSAGDSLRLPCFHVRDSVLVLPAFGEFTGMQAVRPGANDQVYAIGDGRVHLIPAPGPGPRRLKSRLNR